MGDLFSPMEAGERYQSSDVEVRPCLVCAAKGVKSSLCYFQLNYEEAILACSNIECTFPYGSGEHQDEIFIKRAPPATSAVAVQSVLKKKRRLNENNCCFTSGDSNLASSSSQGAVTHPAVRGENQPCLAEIGQQTSIGDSGGNEKYVAQTDVSVQCCKSSIVSSKAVLPTQILPEADDVCIKLSTQEISVQLPVKEVKSGERSEKQVKSADGDHLLTMTSSSITARQHTGSSCDYSNAVGVLHTKTNGSIGKILPDTVGEVAVHINHITSDAGSMLTSMTLEDSDDVKLVGNAINTVVMTAGAANSLSVDINTNAHTSEFVSPVIVSSHSTNTGAVPAASTYLQWENADRLCWLDVVLCLITHNRVLRRLVDELPYDEKNSLLKYLISNYDDAQRLHRQGVNLRRCELLCGAGRTVLLDTGCGQITVKTGGGGDATQRLFGSSSVATIAMETHTGPVLSQALCSIESSSSQVMSNSVTAVKSFDVNNILSKEDSHHVSLKLLSDEASRLERLSKSTMAATRDQIYDSIAQKVGCEKGVNDSALIGLMCMLAQDQRLQSHVAVSYTRTMKCEVCLYQREESVKQDVPTLFNVSADFCMSRHTFCRPCTRCQVPNLNLRISLHIDSFPETFFFHFLEGLPRLDAGQLDFESSDGAVHVVTGVINYTTNPTSHFIVWLRNPLENTWMECDDLRNQVCKFSARLPAFPPSQVHIVMWERAPDGFTLRKRCNSTEPKFAAFKQPMIVKSCSVPSVSSNSKSLVRDILIPMPLNNEQTSTDRLARIKKRLEAERVHLSESRPRLSHLAFSRRPSHPAVTLPAIGYLSNARRCMYPTAEQSEAHILTVIEPTQNKVTGAPIIPMSSASKPQAGLKPPLATLVQHPDLAAVFREKRTVATVNGFEGYVPRSNRTNNLADHQQPSTSYQEPVVVQAKKAKVCFSFNGVEQNSNRVSFAAENESSSAITNAGDLSRNGATSTTTGGNSDCYSGAASVPVCPSATKLSKGILVTPPGLHLNSALKSQSVMCRTPGNKLNALFTSKYGEEVALEEKAVKLDGLNRVDYCSEIASVGAVDSLPLNNELTMDIAAFDSIYDELSRCLPVDESSHTRDTRGKECGEDWSDMHATPMVNSLNCGVHAGDSSHLELDLNNLDIPSFPIVDSLGFDWDSGLSFDWQSQLP